jgi:hypothetical protein
MEWFGLHMNFLGIMQILTFIFTLKIHFQLNSSDLRTPWTGCMKIRECKGHGVNDSKTKFALRRTAGSFWNNQGLHLRNVRAEGVRRDLGRWIKTKWTGLHLVAYKPTSTGALGSRSHDQNPPTLVVNPSGLPAIQRLPSKMSGSAKSTLGSQIDARQWSGQYPFPSNLDRLLGIRRLRRVFHFPANSTAALTEERRCHGWKSMSTARRSKSPLKTRKTKFRHLRIWWNVSYQIARREGHCPWLDAVVCFPPSLCSRWGTRTSVPSTTHDSLGLAAAKSRYHPMHKSWCPMTAQVMGDGGGAGQPPSDGHGLTTWCGSLSWHSSAIWEMQGWTRSYK